ncbi:MAG: phosphatase PAP2 family protein [Actinomycetota bacterium]
MHRRQWVQLTVVVVTLIAVWTCAGWLLTHALSGSRLVHGDQSISAWFARHRTPGWNRLTGIGSMLADTVVKIVVTAIIAIAMLVYWKRWREPLMVVIPLVLEALCFIVVTTLVGRPRPTIALDASPVDSSYPSGHMAAAVAYAAIVVVVFWRTPRRSVRTAAVLVAVALAFAVGFSRLYRGMHYST